MKITKLAHKITNKKHIVSLALFFAIFLTATQLILVQDIKFASGASGSLLDSQIGFEDGEIGKTAFDQTGEPDDIKVIVAKIIKAFLGFMGIIFVVLILSAGYIWMTAGGNEEKVSKAKSTITRAVIGLVIVLISWGVAEFTTNCLSDIAGSSYTKPYCPN